MIDWYYSSFTGEIERIEKCSKVTFVEAQVALAKRWVTGDTITVQKEIVLGIPEEKDIFVPDDGKLKAKPATVKAPIPTDEEAALQSVEVFQNGSYGLQSKAISDNVAQHRLTTNSSLLDEPWLGTEQEELYSWVLLSISVLMIGANHMALPVIYLS